VNKSPSSRPVGDAQGMRVAIAVSDFNSAITEGLLSGALEALASVGVNDPLVVRAPGAFELPLLCQRLVQDHDAVVALGAVIEGETDHYTHIATQTAAGLMRVSLEGGVPVGFGVLTVSDPEHAKARSASGPGNKGAEAAEAAITAALALRQLG